MPTTCRTPRPAYPADEQTAAGEQGKVLVHVLIGVDGTAQQAEILQSSGFDRLDQAALAPFSVALRARQARRRARGHVVQRAHHVCSEINM
jgi:TonB family protein